MRETNCPQTVLNIGIEVFEREDRSVHGSIETRGGEYKRFGADARGVVFTAVLAGREQVRSSPAVRLCQVSNSAGICLIGQLSHRDS
jgi:hypothetical protein